MSLKVTNSLLQLDTIFPSVFAFLQVQKQTKMSRVVKTMKFYPTDEQRNHFVTAAKILAEDKRPLGQKK